MALKIMFDANPLVAPKSGVGHYTKRLVESLAAVSPDVELVGYYFNFLGRHQYDDLPQAPNIRYAQSRLIPGKLLSICRRLGFQLPLHLIAGQPADVALFTNFVALPTPPKTLSIPVIYDLCFFDCPEFVADKNRDFLRRWVPRTIQKADGVIAISEFTKARIIESFDISADKIYITPIPPAPVVKTNDSILKKHGLTNSYLLFVGTIEPRKNILGLVEAYALLPDDTRGNYPLVLAGGKGWHDTEILGRIAELQAQGLPIITTGYVTDDEKSALYKNALFCIQPSHYEGFGMPVLEAMQHKKAVLCSDIPVLHEVAGEAAVYFDPNNPQSLADAIQTWATAPSNIRDYEALGQKRLQTFPGWDVIAGDLYQHLVQLVK